MKGENAGLYKRWKTKIFLCLFFSHLCHTFTRKNLAFAMPYLIKELGFNLQQLGALGSFYNIAFAVAKIFGGIAADHHSTRFLITTSLLLAGLSNSLFGISSSIYLFTLFWAINGFCQGMGWPPIARLLTRWYPKEERATWWAVISSATTLGGAAVAFCGAAVTEHFGWRLTMAIPGIIATSMAIFNFTQLADSPSDVGIVTNWEEQKSGPATESTKFILINYVVKNSMLWLLFFASFFQYIIRTSISDWGVLYLVESKGFSTMTAGSCMVFYEMAGAVGGLSAGMLSDKYFKGNRGAVNVLFTSLSATSLFLMWYGRSQNYWVNCALFLVTGLAIYGPQTLLGVTIAELAHKRATGTVLGIAGAFSGLGGSVAGFPLSTVTQTYGWDGFVLVLFGSAVATVLLLLPPLVVKKSTKED